MRISTDFASLEFFYSLACFTFILSGVFVPSSDGVTCVILLMSEATFSIRLAAR